MPEASLMLARNASAGPSTRPWGLHARAILIFIQPYCAGALRFPARSGGSEHVEVARLVSCSADVRCSGRSAMFFGFNTFDPRHSPAVSAHQESYSSGFTASALG